MNGFSMAGNYFILTNGLGIGFNLMGCSNDYKYYGNYIEQIIAINGNVLNILDGSFLASKLISELGIIGFLIVVFLMIKSIFVLIQGAFKKSYIENEDLINNNRNILIFI